jgi:hypothetical protein
MWGSGLIAVFVVLPYLALSVVAVADGRRGFEIPVEVNIMCLIAIQSCGVVAVAAWVVDRSARHHADHTLRPIIRAECERAMTEAVPELVELVAAELLLRLDPKLHDVAAASVARSSAMLREIVTGEVMRTQLDSAVGRAYRGGMIQQAQAAVGTARVRNIRTVTSTDD